MGRVICTGLGPGVPDLMSLRAARAIAAAPQAAWTRKQGRNGLARSIVKGMLATDTVELPMECPVATGFVSFVSSGPGDPELLTLKAVNRLQAADAVLFDDLSSGPILAHARTGADLVGVGKRAGRASPKQDHVSRLLVDYARTGARVVRLKSGDAGLFGRLEEEIVALNKAAIGHEIIPGVPSACAAAALAGMSMTGRLIARRVQFVTGADVTGDLPRLNMPALADPEATTVVFMGKRTFPALADALVAAGLPHDTPALLAEAVSQPDQQFTRTTLASLADRLRAETGSQPALILYGPLARRCDHG